MAYWPPASSRQPCPHRVLCDVVRPEIAAALDLSPVAISTLYGAATLFGAALLPLLGAWADRWSASRFLGMVVAGLGLSLLTLSCANGPLMLALAWTVSRCLGQGAIGVGVLAALSRAFVESRGRALALGSLGHPFGEFVFPATIAALLTFTTWRESLLMFAALYFVVFAPLVSAGLRSLPRGIQASPGPLSSEPIQSSGLTSGWRVSHWAPSAS